MRYPIAVDQVACQISKNEKSLTMLVENVLQQDRSEDCGLFAIAFAAILSFNQDPVQAVINQSVIRCELLESFQEMNMKRFVTNVVIVDEKKKRKALYRWIHELHCICRMPYDGSNMVACSKGKKWYHEECLWVIAVETTGCAESVTMPEGKMLLKEDDLQPQGKR